MPVEYDPTAYTPKRTDVYMGVARYIFAPLYAAMYRMTYEGRENVPDGPFVAVGNHLSNFDPPLLSAAVDRPVVFLAKKELYKTPGFRQFCLYFGAISVDRQNPEVSTFKAVKEALKHERWCLGMFIEGTRCKTPGTLGPPFTGPAYFARLNKVPLVPVGIIGTHRIGKQAHTRIGKPIQPGQDLEATTWKVMEALSELTGYGLPPRQQLTQTEEASGPVT